MKKFWVIAISGLVSTYVSAGGRNEAYNTVCKSLFNEQSQLSCMQTIKKYNYFNDEALKICSFVFNDHNKLNCLSQIGDKDFEGYEIQQCGKLFNESLKIECLRNNGQQRRSSYCYKKEEVIALLNDSLNLMRMGELNPSDMILSGVIENLKNCL